jgi:hypothetical protein
MPSSVVSPFDVVDQCVGGLETRRDLVVAGLAQHDSG